MIRTQKANKTRNSKIGPFLGQAFKTGGSSQGFSKTGSSEKLKILAAKLFSKPVPQSWMLELFFVGKSVFAVLHLF